MKLRRTIAIAGALVLAATFTPAQAGQGGHAHSLKTIVDLDGPRGVDHLGHGKTLVTEADGTFSKVIERRHKDPKVVELGSVAPGFAPAIAAGRHGKVYILTAGGEPGTGAATLYVWRWGDDEPTPVFDVAAYQEEDPDPYDADGGPPEESNPYDLAALKDGSVLIADAAGNDLIRVWPKTGHAVTVARLKPRLVKVPEALPDEDPEGNPLPPAGTPILAEAVATSVTVGPDGYWYVGELRGFPATPGTSEIWRIKPGSVGAVCNPKAPKKPWNRKCKRYADGLTSIVDLGSSRKSVYAVSLSKQSWLMWEFEQPGAEVGGLFSVTRGQHHKVRIKELVKNKLILPGGVDVGHHDIYLTGPIFGPGSLSKID